MKPVLIDDIQDYTDTQSEFTVEVNGQPMKGYQVAKPLNFDKEYTSKKDRKAMAKLVLEGKAIAVQFFEDLTPEEQTKYVEEKIG
jgi:hypothetical protein